MGLGWSCGSAEAVDVTHHCRCGDHESDHYEELFVSRRADGVKGRACGIAFCRCPDFTPMTAWHAFGAQEPEEAGP